MNSNELNILLFKHNVTKFDFGGVYAQDKLPIKATFRAYIVNLDVSTMEGSHWVAIVFSKNNIKPAVYFDSYGFPPFYPNILKFIERNSSNYVYNAIRLQSDNTFVCGQYCVIFIISMLRNISLHNFQKSFCGDYLKNDKKIYNIVKNLVRHHLEFK